MKTFLALFSTHQPYIQRRQGVEMLQRIFQYVGVLPPFKRLHRIRVRPPCLTLGSYKKKRSDGVPAMLTTVVEAIKHHVSIPPSSDDDRDSLQNENLSHSESGTRPPRRHGRICVPMSFSGIRKQMGKKRFRRYENVYNLAVLAEGEELTEVSIRDFMPHSHFQFSKLLEHENGLEVG
uniref:Uncharacterized protein n=1 Tax=Timema shepardi TaxID=629360 RepID=A0A7R9BAP4_TIMSH|nr:unnamed protein product [Timema shepardi]